MKGRLRVPALLAVLGAVALLLAYFELRPMLARGPAPAPAEIQALTQKRRQLRERFREVLDQHDAIDFASAPPGNVLVGVPTSFAEDLLGQMIRGLFSEVRLHLKDVRAHHEGDVRAKVLFTQKVGRFTLDVDVKDIRAVLKPAQAQLTFGGDRIGMRLPVTVVDGHGTGNVRFQWQGTGLAGAVCGDLDVSHEVSSDVTPATYLLAGEFLLAAEGETVVAKPLFGEITLKVVLSPTERTWAALESTVEDVREDKNGICRMAIRKLDVSSIVRKIIDRGFDVKLPAKLFEPIALPAAVEQSIEVDGRTLTLDAKPVGLHVTPVMLWYGAAVGAVGEEGPRADRPPR